MASPEKIIADESTIGEYLPQKAPMVMIGQLLAADGKRARTSFLIRKENLFCSDGSFHEAGLIENMAQTAAAGLGYLSRNKNQEPPVGFIGGLKNLNVSELPRCGDEIITEITIEHEVLNATVATGRVYLQERCIAECELKIFLNPG